MNALRNWLRESNTNCFILLGGFIVTAWLIADIDVKEVSHDLQDYWNVMRRIGR